MNTAITAFRGQYDFLSNFYTSPLEYDGLPFLNAEAAFQSAKLLDVELRKEFCKLDASRAKKLGRRVMLREDWEDIKTEIMVGVIDAKFRNPELAVRLLATGDAVLIEGNTWHDNFWGVCNCIKCKHIEGKNLLGLILMDLRARKKTESPIKVQMSSMYGSCK